MAKITVDQVNAWMSEPKEHQRLEFKEAKQQFDSRKLNEYCVAIANEGGGYFLMGITDKHPRHVVGTSAYQDTGTITQELFRRLGFRIDVEVVNHSQGRVVIFIIPSRPSGMPYHIDGKYMMRSGEELVPMSPDRLRSIFDEGKPDWLEERSKEDLDSQQVVELLDTQTYFELRQLPYPSRREEVLNKLVQDKLLSGSAKEGFTISRLCALLLAKRLDDFQDISRKAARVIVYSGNSKMTTTLEQISGKGYAVGFEGLVTFVMSQLPQNEVIVGALRREHKLIAAPVIRELIANALIHQDFAISGSSVMVEIYSNRIEISNPGKPIVDVERFVDGSQSRNERLASLMRKLGICEEKGSGIDNVISTIEAYQLPAPDFGLHHNQTFARIFGPKSFESMQRDDRIRACYQHACIRRVMSEPMTNTSLRERFGLAELRKVSVSQVIAATIEENLIKPDEKTGGSKRLARYLPYWA